MHQEENNYPEDRQNEAHVTEPDKGNLPRPGNTSQQGEDNQKSPGGSKADLPNDDEQQQAGKMPNKGESDGGAGS